MTAKRRRKLRVVYFDDGAERGCIETGDGRHVCVVHRVHGEGRSAFRRRARSLQSALEQAPELVVLGGEGR